MTTTGVMRAVATCPSCGGSVDVKSRHVAVAGGAVRIYCSEACLAARDAPPVLVTPAVEPPPRRRIWWIAGCLVAGTTTIVLAYGNGAAAPQNDPPALSIVETAMEPPADPEPPAPAEAGSAAAQPADDTQADAALVDELAHDAWIHPLAGPTRVMPSIPDAAFGALRPGERPPECVSGHCGVDIGTAWGEPVHAVHDGVVDWVNRGPNDEHGGIFVKLAHRDGTLYSWYFHLAAVPRWVQPGAKVKLGQVIGLLGDTGVGHSGAHLHLSLSVRPSKAAKERYIDPEPLIAIWPLWVANDNAASGHVTLTAAPGTPVRQDGWRPHPRPRPAASDVGSAAAPAPAAAPDPAAAPAPDTPEPGPATSGG